VNRTILAFFFIGGCLFGNDASETKGTHDEAPGRPTPLEACRDKAVSAAGYVCSLEGDVAESEIVISGVDFESDIVFVHANTGQGYPNFCDVEVTFADPCVLTSIDLTID